MWKTGNTKKWKFTGFIFILILVCTRYGCALYDQHKVTNYQSVLPFDAMGKSHEPGYLRFVSVGDVGTGGPGQTLVANAMAQQASITPVDFVLMLGDNFYSYGVESVYDRQWETKFQSMYYQSSLEIPFYAVLGNHDHLGNPDAQVAYTNIPGNSRWKMPSRYYSFTWLIDDFAAVQFFALDTTSIAYGKSEALQQIKWLEDMLKNSKAEWKIVFGHHMLYSGGRYGDNELMKKMLEGLFMKYKVDVYLSGHDHDQQLLGPVEGVHYIVNGAGSKIRYTGRQQNTIYANSNLGFVSFRISHDELMAAFINIEGTAKYTYSIKNRLQ